MKAKENWKSRKLSDESIRGIIFAAKEGHTQRQISLMYQISQCYVSRLLNGKASRVKVC